MALEKARMFSQLSLENELLRSKIRKINSSVDVAVNEALPCDSEARAGISRADLNIIDIGSPLVSHLSIQSHSFKPSLDLDSLTYFLQNYLLSDECLSSLPTSSGILLRRNNLLLLEKGLWSLECVDGNKFLFLEKIDPTPNLHLGFVSLVNVYPAFKPQSNPTTFKRKTQTKRNYSDTTLDDPHVMTVQINKPIPEILKLHNLIDKPSAADQNNLEVWGEIKELISKKSSMQILVNEVFEGKINNDIPFREFCDWGLKADCWNNRKNNYPCTKLHFRHIITPNTVLKEGDCSYLNTCHNMDKCKYVHYELDEDGLVSDIERGIPIIDVGTVWPAQWFNCDVRTFDLRTLGKFSVIMADRRLF
ncbi:N6-adenosine-methyltransferase subunit mettl3 [Nowakowskiella sp. JEL0078]|nr:N6-adenosine-methyltransferase subunit mettl3 [Nowakowskiella sp. JEL0078]